MIAAKHLQLEVENGVPVIHAVYSNNEMMILFRRRERAVKHVEQMQQYVPETEHRLETYRVQID